MTTSDNIQKGFLSGFALSNSLTEYNLDNIFFFYHEGNMLKILIPEFLVIYTESFNTRDSIYHKKMVLK